MKTYSVVFAPEAEDDLVELYDYIAEHGSPTIAARYAEAIIEYCEGLATFAHRGTRRDDIRSGLRITNYKHSAVIGSPYSGACLLLRAVGAARQALPAGGSCCGGLRFAPTPLRCSAWGRAANSLRSLRPPWPAGMRSIAVGVTFPDRQFGGVAVYGRPKAVAHDDASDRGATRIIQPG